ncbi:MAG: ribosome maturation factor RimM [Anaerolineales bacterium]|nr:ribosome maturation factor RimM [Anaerolineales bacterium]MDW8226280.1 ribosome maturation factor RimM [Anaerolineales bacterium]
MSSNPEKMNNARVSAGSPNQSEPAFVAVGKIRRPHGVRGDVLVELYTDFPERLVPKKVLYLGESHQRVVVRRRRSHREGLLLAFEDYDTPEAVGEFRNQILYVATHDLPPLPEGEYYFHELIGLAVEDETGRFLGRLEQILETGANDVYVVVPASGREILLPAIEEVILSVDRENRKMVVHLLPGLLEEEA